MKLHLVQYAPSWENKEENKQKLSSLILNKIIRSDVPQLIILPEMTLTGFTMKSSSFSEEPEGETFNYYSEIALKYKSWIAGGIIEKAGDKFYNTLLIVSPQGKLHGSYRKIHPFSFSTEDQFYSKGQAPVIVDIEGWKTGLSICYDLRFPELYRQYGKQRVDLILNIANWPDTRIEHWKTLNKARAIENQCFFAGVNRTGDSGKLVYNGQSGVYDPLGNLVTELTEKETVISADINKDTVAETRAKFPFLQDITLI